MPEIVLSRSKALPPGLYPGCVVTCFNHEDQAPNGQTKDPQHQGDSEPRSGDFPTDDPSLPARHKAELAWEAATAEAQNNTPDVFIGSDVMVLARGKIWHKPCNITDRSEAELREEAVELYTSDPLHVQWTVWFAAIFRRDLDSQWVKKLAWINVTASFPQPLTKQQVERSFSPKSNAFIPAIELAIKNGAKLDARYPGSDTEQPISPLLAHLLIVGKALPLPALLALRDDHGHPVPGSRNGHGQESNGRLSDWRLNSERWLNKLIFDTMLSKQQPENHH